VTVTTQLNFGPCFSSRSRKNFVSPTDEISPERSRAPRAGIVAKARSSAFIE